MQNSIHKQGEISLPEVNPNRLSENVSFISYISIDFQIIWMMLPLKCDCHKMYCNETILMHIYLLIVQQDKHFVWDLFKKSLKIPKG